MSKLTILVHRLSPTAKLPEKAYDTDAGFDVFSDDVTKVIDPGHRMVFKTNIALGLPDGYCAILKDRSGNAIKRGLHVLAGIIDREYTGQVLACLQNLSNKPVSVHKGDKIAQFLLTKVPEADIVEVTRLDETDRGDKGFGSSGD